MHTAVSPLDFRTVEEHEVEPEWLQYTPSPLPPSLPETATYPHRSHIPDHILCPIYPFHIAIKTGGVAFSQEQIYLWYIRASKKTDIFWKLLRFIRSGLVWLSPAQGEIFSPIIQWLEHHQSSVLADPGKSWFSLSPFKALDCLNGTWIFWDSTWSRETSYPQPEKLSFYRFFFFSGANPAPQESIDPGWSVAKCGKVYSGPGVSYWNSQNIQEVFIILPVRLWITFSHSLPYL